ncbi:hypothetical protein NA78x_001591 [Anatilimnocola sp. NA78]|uniref:hypothetical protein n=1 Tax=Anatilimnocola sp. NA78 TaxID=3415683 RepID=UPI003CE5682B
MNFRIDCPCGGLLEVSAIDAGLTRRCACGEGYLVPRIGELRKLEAAGETSLPPILAREMQRPYRPAPAVPIVYNEIEKLRLLDLRGKLPLEKRCLECNTETTHVVNSCIDCEPPPPKAAADFFANVIIGGLVALVAPLVALRYVVNSTEEKEGEPGTSKVIHAPLRLCADCASRLVQDPKVVRDLLSKRPLYEPLFRNYPDAEVKLPNH